jgi:hypothetical protein
MLRRLLPLILVAVLVAHQGGAQVPHGHSPVGDDRWLHIGQAGYPDGSYQLVYIDTTTVTWPDLRVARGWILARWSRLQNESDDPRFAYDESLALVEADCTERRTRALGMVLKRSGHVVFSSLSDPPLAWMVVVPGTSGETHYNALCGYSNG